MSRATDGGATTKRPLAPPDLYRFTFVADPQLAPDGGEVAFVRTTIDRDQNQYQSQIWVAPFDGSVPARRFTRGPLDTAPRWSPDGEYLAFLRKPRGKDARAQLWLVRRAGGEAWRLTDVPGGAADPAWSPAGDALVFTSKVASNPAADTTADNGGDVRVIDRLTYKLDGEGFDDGRRRHLFVVPLSTSQVAARQVTGGDFDDTDPVWAPDGQALAFVSARHDNREYDRWRDVWVVPATGGEPRRVTRTTGPCAGPVYAPNGQTIAYTGHDNQPQYGPTTQPTIWVVPTSGDAAPRPLGRQLDRPVGSDVGTDMRYGTPEPRLIWTPDGGALYALLSCEGRVSVQRIDAMTGESSTIVGGDRQVTNVSASRDGRRLALAISSATMPADIFSLDLATGREQRLTDVNAALFEAIEIRAPERFRYDAPDGQALDGWLVTPAGFDPARRYPLILEIHGGPHAAYGESFYFEFQLLAARGYLVLYTNPRGSTSYGQSFVSALRQDWGGVDYRDVMAGVDAVIARGVVDESRLGVTGGSYGGYLTNWIIGQTNRFRAAVSGRSTCNRASHYGHSDIGSFIGDWEFGGPPWERADHYRERSPITYVANVRTPVLLENQEQDHRCPVPQAEEFYTALKKLRRVDVQFIRFPDESHGMARQGHPVHRVERLERIVAWFDTYLQDGAPTPSMSPNGTAASEGTQ